MATYNIAISSGIFKNSGDFHRYSCLSCGKLLSDPVQLACGHRLCRSCAEHLIVSAKKEESQPRCPDRDCDEELSDEDGAYFFPDRFVQREILNLIVICPFGEYGCNWEGRFEDYLPHVESCTFAQSTCEYCGERLQRSQLTAHYNQTCPKAPKQCPLSGIGCSMPATSKDHLQLHMERDVAEHFGLLVSKVRSLEERFAIIQNHTGTSNVQLKEKALRKDFVESDGAVSFGQRCDSGIENCVQTLKLKSPTKTQLDTRVQDRDVPSSRMPLGLENNVQTIIDSMVTKRLAEVREELRKSFGAELRVKDEEISELKAMVHKMEKTIRAKNSELEDRDFRLSLIENGNYDGSMIWKIPQFSQRKTDAENGKYTSIFSLPFYSSRYGYKMCLRLYIMGDGIGKGTHLSLFFVVMKGEFDNILQWPFTHKVTFKLINQAGGRDIVDTFQPDPMSSSFRKPRSDMNVASGCPRFVSHTELERGGFIVNDTIFIKCIIDTKTICDP